MKGYAFRLIKEFPGSDRLGTIYEFDESWQLYRSGKRFSTLWKHGYFMEWVGEYFELEKTI